jgi:hypothetical protein
MVLRYRFNLTARPEDDPVFVTNPSATADAQFLKDCEYFKLQNKPLLLLEGVQNLFAKSAEDAAIAKLAVDKPVVVKGGFLSYGTRRFKDVAGLGSINATNAFALHVRYEYLKLDNHGLARIYKGDKSSATEGFASAFNHYFSEYCSAFPDLEAVFGSKGSFFEQVKFDTPVVFINPPFDESVLSSAFERVYKLLAEGATNTFVFTVPGWEDYQPLIKLENSKWTHNIRDFPKGDLKFLDHMTGKTITPCDIVQVVLGNDEETAKKVAETLTE